MNNKQIKTYCLIIITIVIVICGITYFQDIQEKQEYFKKQEKQKIEIERQEIEQECNKCWVSCEQIWFPKFVNWYYSGIDISSTKYGKCCIECSNERRKSFQNLSKTMYNLTK